MELPKTRLLFTSKIKAIFGICTKKTKRIVTTLQPGGFHGVPGAPGHSLLIWEDQGLSLRELQSASPALGAHNSETSGLTELIRTLLTPKVINQGELITLRI